MGSSRCCLGVGGQEMKRPKASIVVTGSVWAYGGKIYWDSEYGSYSQFVIKVPRRQCMGAFRLDARIYVNWFKGSWLPASGEWLECTGVFGGAAVQEIIDKPSRINLVLMCFGDGDVKRLDPNK